MPRVLEVEHLSTDIRLSRSVVHAVGDVSFHIDAGETLGLVGESGSGKSMTGLSVMGLLPKGGRISGGSVRLEGRELVGLPATGMRAVRGNDIAMIFQDSLTSLNPTKTIGAQIAEPVLLHRGAGRREALDRAAEVLALVGMPSPRQRLGDYPHQLSGGLRQRVMIAIALACEPKLLIADEPTTALDVTIQAQILTLLDDLKKRLSMAILLVTHDMGVVAGHADRVNVMYAGRMVESAGTGELFTAMHHPYSQALLGSIPRLDSDPSEALFSIPGLPPDLTRPPAGCRFAARCTRATERCRTEEPPLGGTGDHAFACWHPVDGPVTELPRLPHAAGALGDAERPLLVAEGMVREYPVTAGAVLKRKVGSAKAVSGISLSVRAGETLGLVGESGCGKSTLGRMLAGLDRPDAGHLAFNGEPLFERRGRALRRSRRSIQMMFQDPYASLDPRMRVGSTLREPLVIQGIGSRREQDERVRAMLDEVGLPAEATHRYPHEFSGGQRQRIGLARTLMLSPEIIIADEPVSALDVSVRSQVLNLLKRLQARHGMAAVVISHDLAVVKYLADRIGVMYLGKLVELGPADDIHRRPAHPYTRALIDTIPLPDPAAERAKGAPAVTGDLPSPFAPPSGCRFRTRCPLATERCAQEEPALREIAPDQLVACHFPLPTPEMSAP